LVKDGNAEEIKFNADCYIPVCLTLGAQSKMFLFMINNKQDKAVVFLYNLGYSRIRNYLLKLYRRPVTRFLVFHDVATSHRENFESNMSFLKLNTNVVSLEEFFAGILSTVKINTVITFDDGYKGWIVNALPVLKKLSLPATFFISSGFVGLDKIKEEVFIKKNLFTKLPPREITGGLSNDDLKKLASDGFTIGGHTLNHCVLDSALDVMKIKHEIVADKNNLEILTGRKVNYFSYPTGAYYNTHINLTEILIQANYKGAVTVVPGFNTSATNPYMLCRDIVSASMPYKIFRARVLGNYDALRLLKNMLS